MYYILILTNFCILMAARTSGLLTCRHWRLPTLADQVQCAPYLTLQYTACIVCHIEHSSVVPVFNGQCCRGISSASHRRNLMEQKNNSHIQKIVCLYGMSLLITCVAEDMYYCNLSFSFYFCFYSISHLLY